MLAFSMRRTSHDGDDDFHLYVMELMFGAGSNRNPNGSSEFPVHPEDAWFCRVMPARRWTPRRSP